MPEPKLTQPKLSRRHFLEWMAASSVLAAASLPSCRRAEQFIVPYNEGPEWTLPGLATSYATCFPGSRSAIPLLAVCYEGRPTKLVPHLQYPSSSGLDPIVQASILELYSPERSRHPYFQNKQATKEELNGAFTSWAHKLSTGGKIAFLFGRENNSIRKDLINDIRRRNPQAKFYEWEPSNTQGLENALNDVLRPGVKQVVRLDRAKKILSLDADFLGLDPVAPKKQYSSLKTPEGLGYKDKHGDYTQQPKLFMAEGRISLTGIMADKRLPCPPSQIPTILWHLSQKISQLTKFDVLAKLPTHTVQLSSDQEQWINQCAQELVEASGSSLILLGSEYPECLHQLVLSLNTALKAPGRTQLFIQGEAQELDSLRSLIIDAKAGKIETLFILTGSNPLYDAPTDIDLQALLALPHLDSIHLGLYRDETAKASTWHIPAAHYLETWGMERDALGVLCYRQPVILPLYGGYSEIEILSGLLNSKGLLNSADDMPDKLSPAYHRIRRCFNKILDPPNKDASWQEALQRGFSPETAFPLINATPRPPSADILRACLELANPSEKNQDKDLIEIQLILDYKVFDGRYARNQWLQELPDPISGLSWDAGALMSPATAEALNGSDGNHKILEIAVSGSRALQFIACPMPEIPDNLIVLPLGYGSEQSLNIQGNINSNAYALRQNAQNILIHIKRDRLRLSNKIKRKIARTAITNITPHTSNTPPVITVAQAATQAGSEPSLQLTAESDKLHQWGMTIDLNLCNGCNACLIACQAENNIPCVGREEIAQGRSMQWIRIDRYLQRASEKMDPIFLTQPVACQQCQIAPCESVCPVNAIVHSSEGLNAMVYPRCWGTRYCANNCPYKARHFNFFDYAKRSDKETRLQRNPNVTVRSRGVMEKCSYCIQRIVDAQMRHKGQLAKRTPALLSHELELSDEDLRLPSSSVQTACQLACPYQAIQFGNLLEKDKQTETVSLAKSSPRNQTALSQMGTQPRTSYLAKIINT